MGEGVGELRLERRLSVKLKGATSRYFESFSVSLVRKKNIKEVLITQEGTRMNKDGED